MSDLREVVLSKQVLRDAIKLALKTSPFENVSLHIFGLLPEAREIYLLLDFVQPPLAECKSLDICDRKEECNIKAFMTWCRPHLNVPITLPELPVQLSMTALTITVSSKNEKYVYCRITSSQEVSFKYQ